MQEFSEFMLPKFEDGTKGDASDWINQNMRKAHEIIDRYESSH